MSEALRTLAEVVIGGALGWLIGFAAGRIAARGKQRTTAQEGSKQ
ncbi:hypothetical protein [Bordetella hinzii]|nr:hypothetical protein [Bordetella hinzii]